MNCKGEDATHFACDCFIEREAKLRQALAIVVSTMDFLKRRNAPHNQIFTDKEIIDKRTTDEICAETFSKIKQLLGEEKPYTTIGE